MSGIHTGNCGAVGKPLWPEDTVEYKLYAKGALSEDLTKLAVECIHFAKQRLKGHLWHYGEFVLQVIKGDHDHPPHLYGRTCYRDNIEDEWLIVYLLFSLSQHNTDIVISVADGDGEFLLIQSAHHLPKWVKPETATNRVYIYNGLLHIIPKPNSPSDIQRLPVAVPTIKEAIEIVTDPSIPTAASERVQSSIHTRIKCFSGSLDHLYHSTLVHLPFPAAHVLTHDPSLLPAVVHALCDRDPLVSRHAQRMKHSPLSPLKHSSLTMCVKLTKLLYAKLVHEQYSPPRNCGFTVAPPGDPLHRAHDLGMKLTCGLDMLLERVSQPSTAPENTGSLQGGDEKWTAFVGSLQEKGYFRGELEGSKGHQLLMATAKEYFTTQQNLVTTEADKDTAKDSHHNVGCTVSHILQNISYTEEELREKWAELPPSDDDSWLELSPEQLEDMLHISAGYPPSKGAGPVDEDEGTVSGELDLQSLLFGMRSFVDKVSSHKGAEFPWNADEPSAVNFDPNSFLSTLQSMLDDSAAKKGSENVDSDDSLSDDDLSISSNEGGMASDEEGGPSVTQLMADMDLELAQTELGKSFEKAEVVEEERSEEQQEDLRPVDVDFNLVKNLLDSYSSQGGGAGPASNILGSLGVHVPEQANID